MINSAEFENRNNISFIKVVVVVEEWGVTNQYFLADYNHAVNILWIS
jgi:hypothetical protein